MHKIYVMLVLRTEAATRGVLWKKVLLKISQNLQENTCARVYTLKKEILERVFSCQFYEIFKNTFFTKQFERIWINHSRDWINNFSIISGRSKIVILNLTISILTFLRWLAWLKQNYFFMEWFYYNLIMLIK